MRRGDRDEHLRAVGDDALKDAGERVKERRGLARGDALFLAHFLGDGVCHNDGDGVVRGGNVHRADEKAHADLAAALAAKRLSDPAEQRFKAAVLTDQRTDGGDQNCDHRGFKHPGRAAAHVLEQRLDCEDAGLPRRAGRERDDRAGYDTDEQHDKDVDTDDAADEHEHIGDDLNEIVGRNLRRCHVGVERQHEDECERRERGGEGDVEIFAEFVLHRAALPVAGGDGRVGNEAQIVTEHCPAHDGRDTQRQGIAARRGDGDGNGRDERDGADARAHRGGDKAAYDEQHRHGEF